MRDLLLSPFGVILIFVAAALGFFVFVLPARYKKHSAALLRHFHGALPFASHEIRFSFARVSFRIARVGRGSGVGQGGSYPVLWTYVSPMSKCIIGHAQAAKYTLGQFLTLPEHAIVSRTSSSFLVGGDDAWRRRATQLIETDEQTRGSLDELMQRPFDYLTVANEIHVSLSGFRKRCVLRVQALPEDIYSEPEKLEARLEVILRVCNKLGIELSPAA